MYVSYSTRYGLGLGYQAYLAIVPSRESLKGQK
jgi:hypothetical protein